MVTNTCNWPQTWIQFCTIILSNLVILRYQCQKYKDNSQTSWSTVFVEKLTVAQQVKKFQYFVEPEGSLLCSQEPSTGLYSGSDECSLKVHNLPPYFSKTELIVSSMPRSSKWFLLFRYSCQNPVCTSCLSHVCCVHFYKKLARNIVHARARFLLNIL
jgi:hypothetical protein